MGKEWEERYFALLGELNRRRRLDAKLRELRDLIDEILEEDEKWWTE